MKHIKTFLLEKVKMPRQLAIEQQNDRLVDELDELQETLAYDRY